MKSVEVTKISYYPPSKAYKVMLVEANSKQEFPVIVGTMEAQSIALALEGINLPRPMTHDLICNILKQFDARIDKIIIKNQKNGTLFSQIVISYPNNNIIKIDSRPSDAIAIALRLSSKIYISDSLIQNLKSDSLFIEDSDENLVKTKSIKSGKNVLNNLNEALTRAIEDEDYEVAAKLRDRIQYIKKDI